MSSQAAWQACSAADMATAFAATLVATCTNMAMILQHRYVHGFCDVVAFCSVLLLAMILSVFLCRRRVRLCTVGVLPGEHGEDDHGE